MINCLDQTHHNPRTERTTIPRPISIEIELFGHLRLLQASVFHFEVWEEPRLLPYEIAHGNRADPRVCYHSIHDRFVGADLCVRLKLLPYK